MESILLSLPLAFQMCGADEVERQMAPDRVIEAVDVMGDRSPCPEDGAPDELGFQCLEERLDHRIVITIAFSGH